MNRLDRYLVREILAPTAVAFMAYTGFMLLRGLVIYSDLVLQSENPMRDTGLVLAFSAPHIVVLTIPVAFLLGLLVGIGRLSADSELVALRASGIDLLTLYRPIGLLASACCALTLFLMVVVVPRSNHVLYQMRLQLSTFAVSQRIQPGLFSPEFAGRRIYVEEASADRKTLTGLIVSDRSNPDDGERLTIARRGMLESEEDRGRLWLRLEDAQTYHVAPDPSRFDRASYAVQRLLLVDASPRGPYEKQLREQTLPELLRRSQGARSEVERRSTLVELHKKFALPAACLAFGLLGLPLGIVNRRGGRAAGFAISVAIVLGYYVLLASGEARAIEGSTTAFRAMWLPNVALVAFGLYALARARKDRPLFPELRAWSPTSVSRRESASEAPTEEPRAEGASAAARRWRFFPSGFLLDRYVAARFLRVFLLVATSFVVLYVVIDYMEISDDIAKNHPPRALVLGYYEALLPPILLQVIPFAFLVGALVATAALVRSAETTAMLAHGVSLFRATASLLLLASVTGVGLYYLADGFVPRAQAESERLRDIILKHPPVRVSGENDAWFRGESGRFFSVDLFDAARSSVTGISILELDPKTYRLIRRTDAKHGRLVPNRGLALTDGWSRSLGPSGESLFLRRDGEFFVDAPEVGKVFFAGRTDPRQMSTHDLRRFIDARRRAGADVAALETGLYQKSADAMSALLLTLLGLPYSFRFGRRGAAAGIGIALVLGMTYLFFSQGVLVKAGQTGALSPFLAAWGGNILVGLAATYGLLGVRT